MITITCFCNKLGYLRVCLSYRASDGGFWMITVATTSTCFWNKLSNVRVCFSYTRRESDGGLWIVTSR